jgi:hypothetical protein
MPYFAWVLKDRFLSLSEICIILRETEKDVRCTIELAGMNQLHHSAFGVPRAESPTYSYWDAAYLSVWRHSYKPIDTRKRLVVAKEFLDELSRSLPEETYTLRQLSDEEISSLFLELCDEIAFTSWERKWIDAKTLSKELVSNFFMVDNIVQFDRAILTDCLYS